MIELSSKFYEFLDGIKLTEAKLTDIKKGRDAVREKIIRHYIDEKKARPHFCMQGSYRMGTMIQALPNIEYDIDDGIYLQNYNGIAKDNWNTVDEIHDEIYEIVKNHTDCVEDKNTCIRITYAKNYHLDLPVYIIHDEVAYLAHLQKGWTESDPKALRDWFINKVKEEGEELRYCVKLIKAWKDNLNKNDEVIDFCGLAITILVTNNFVYDEDLLSSLMQTITEIISSLEEMFCCYKPVNPKDEDLFEKLYQFQKDRIIEELKRLNAILEESRNEDNEKKACERLKDIFGDRFPTGSEQITNQKFIKTVAPAVLNKDGRSA